MVEAVITDYVAVLDQVRQRIREARYQALRSVNKELISLYWDIGMAIVEQQGDEKYGRSLVEQLSSDIRVEFPGLRGFSPRNLWYMRNFYLTYRRNEKLQQLVAEIGWSHNVVIMDRCTDEPEREFYIGMAVRHGWSRNVLIHQIESRAYQNMLSGQTNFSSTLPTVTAAEVSLAIKDEYTFDFLDLGEQYSECQLETALIGKVESFLQEMGGVFSFMGSQYRLEVGEKEYFLDLLLYHRLLRCMVAIELKIGEFLPEYVGKMQFYLAVLDDTVKVEGENPSIGIIICKSKDKTIVEYALRDTKRPMGVASYTVTARLPDELEGKMPGPEQVAKLMRD